MLCTPYYQPPRDDAGPAQYQCLKSTVIGPTLNSAGSAYRLTILCTPCSWYSVLVQFLRQVSRDAVDPKSMTTIL